MTPARILRAAEVLRDEAQCLKESFGRPPDFHWPEAQDTDDSDVRARADHDEMVELAGELEGLSAALIEWRAIALDANLDLGDRLQRIIARIDGVQRDG